jgi:pantoate--beta-alanine ligase
VVTKLFTIVLPARSYFGEKDFQQLAVIRRLHADLNLSGEVIGVPTVRDADGLALSSRNVRLSSEERRQAAAIPRALFAMQAAAASGEGSSSALIDLGRAVLAEEPDLVCEYLAVVDPATLEPIDDVFACGRVLLTVRAGQTRLLDNVAIKATNAR